MRTHAAIAALALGLAACTPASETAPAASAKWEVTEFIPPSPFQGIHGLAIDPDGMVLAGSVVGQTIYAVNPQSGEVSVRIGPPNGMADDIAYGPDGVMAWTGYLAGKVFVQEKGGEPREVATGLPGANSLAFTKDGKLYVTQVFLGDALHEVDWKGTGGARLIKSDLGGLNGFEIGPDGMIYGPLWFKGVIARVDPATGTARDVATGFQVPAAANFGPDGNLYAIDTKTGELKRIDMKTRQVGLVAQLAPAIDNLAITPAGLIYVSNMADATVYEVDPATKAVRTVVSGKLASPADLALTDGPEGEKLHVADVFAYRVIDTATGEIKDPLRMQRDPLEYPLGVGAGASKILLTSWAGGVVFQLDRVTGATQTVHHALAAPVDALELADGRLLVLEAAKGAVSILDPAKPAAADNPPAALASGLNMPVAMAEGPDGKLYVTEAGSGSLARIDLASGAIERVASNLQSPEGIDVSADGRIYLAEANAGKLVVFDPKDSTVTMVAEGLKTGRPAAEGSLPAYITTGVAVSKKDGSVYVASDLTNAIYRIKPPAK